MTAEIIDGADTSGWSPPIQVLNEAGTSDVVLVCEHAPNCLPAEYSTLGFRRMSSSAISAKT